MRAVDEVYYGAALLKVRFDYQVGRVIRDIEYQAQKAKRQQEYQAMLARQELEQKQFYDLLAVRREMEAKLKERQVSDRAAGENEEVILIFSVRTSLALPRELKSKLGFFLLLGIKEAASQFGTQLKENLNEAQQDLGRAVEIAKQDLAPIERAISDTKMVTIFIIVYPASRRGRRGRGSGMVAFS